MSNTNKTTVKDKSEILFLFEGIYNEPNGDPFTGEQRYDEETKNILISDVRIKRYIRDFIDENDEKEKIYVKLDRTNVSETGKETGAAARMKSLHLEYEAKVIPQKMEEIKQLLLKENGVESEDDLLIKLKEKDKAKKKKTTLKAYLEDKLGKPEAAKVLATCIDVRLFGGISTETGNTANITGSVQFALLNSSLNKVDLRMHQTTTVFPSKMKTATGGEQRGSIGTKTLVPYSINQIHGWYNPKSGEKTGVSRQDIEKMYSALWHEINNKNTRTKSNQNAVLLLEIVYNNPFDKIYRVDKLISIKPKENKESEQIRSMEDYEFNFSKLAEAIKDVKVKQVNYYSAVDGFVVDVKNAISEEENKEKLVKMTLHDFSKKAENSKTKDS